MADRCPEDHTPMPEGYLQWHEAARTMATTHKQRRCSECSLYAIWEPKKPRSEAAPVGRPS